MSDSKSDEEAEANVEVNPYRTVIAIFIGRNAEKFLKVYDKTSGDLSKVAIGWIWPAFFVAFPWMLYRKLYIEAGVYFCCSLALALVAPTAGTAVGIVLSIMAAMLGKSYYLQKADRKIKLGLDEGGDLDAVEQRIAQAGGVSKVAAWVGAVFMVLMIAVGVVIQVSAEMAKR
jgi:hypothetical protein